MEYDPVAYWSRRAIKYAPEHRDSEEFQLLGEVVHSMSPKSVLEVGSGSGRVFSYLRESGVLRDIISYTMVDFVEAMRENCYANTEVKPDAWDGCTLPYDENAYNLVISFNVALHVPPGDIRVFMQEHMRVGEKLYLVSYWRGYDNLSPHVFEHDYYGLFREFGGVIEMDYTFGDEIQRKHWLVGGQIG